MSGPVITGWCSGCEEFKRELASLRALLRTIRRSQSDPIQWVAAIDAALDGKFRAAAGGGE